MRKGQSISATRRAERSRATTRIAFARELMMAGILARIWPSYTTTPPVPNESYPYLLCVQSPAGLLVWRLATDEYVFFQEWVPSRPRHGEMPKDRLPTLQTLAANGWQ